MVGAKGAYVGLTFWTQWPSREALAKQGRTATQRGLAWLMRLAVLAALVWDAVANRQTAGTRSMLTLVVAVLLTGVIVYGLIHYTLGHRLWQSVAMMALLIGAAYMAWSAQAEVVATVLWCGCAVMAIERLPLAAAALVATGALGSYVTVGSTDSGLNKALSVVGICLVGYVMRLDAEARGNTQRMLAQERAARAAEAESAALRERGRIAREIHDVLAHSLSAQMVHLEAARLLIERGGEREEVLDRVVAARRMARQGLAETRQALSALRGEMTPAEEFLRELVESEGARLRIDGERRELPAEAGLAVRRVAQEAMTNARKHAPGAMVAVRLDYQPGEVELEVRDFGGQPVDNGLSASGAGYGLLGMRERAELLGGTLEAGPAEEGFVVRLRVPA
ncbi:histidine kinase [Streptomyces sp. ICBB 8177]|uniref:sensor histidine kinase n=1 Tax=Streptomyces sp. ICBB 8177 TaxID=563922 RepID=UPI000D677E33|nr:histidine kinase [Streptomyces sp. ICBB 8177]PWI45596.1 two-component sensor histidine kinase [Streptomyces sp. ICBB 8177]